MRQPNARLAALMAAMLLGLMPAVQAAPEGSALGPPRHGESPPAARGGEREGDRNTDRSGARAAERAVERAAERGGGRGGERAAERPAPRPDAHVVPPRRDPPSRHVEPPRWWDGAHGHARHYPAPGHAVRTVPSHARVVFWAGVNYNFWDGVWYAPGPYGYAVVRPPIGIFIHDLPTFRTALVIGGLTYYYVNGVYYRERQEGGYEVVPTPVDPGTGAPQPATDKLYIYPRQGQSAQQQATDDYECHRWAATQTGFDPSATAAGQPGGDAARRADYQRARTACLEGRGYTVR
ncbi:MAG: hypothetical protein HY855_13700 [Burkholderiales bacterium]|nr:hypothetical protein [Burkholderiales bacterium]